MSDETLTNADLAAAYKMLEDHEKLWDHAQAQVNAEVPCGTCGGRARQEAGSLGNASCWECGGSGTVPDPFADDQLDYPAELVAGRGDLKQLAAAYDAAAASGSAPPPKSALEPVLAKLAAVPNPKEEVKRRLAAGRAPQQLEGARQRPAQLRGQQGESEGYGTLGGGGVDPLDEIDP